MIDQIDNALRNWIATTLKRLNASEAFTVVLGPVDRAPDAPHVGLHLLDVRPGSPRFNSRQPAVEIVARHLITVHQADDAIQAHRVLGELLLSVLESPLPTSGDAGMKVEPDSIPLQPADWLAFSVPPRPSFVIRTPVRRARALPDAPRVTQGIDVDWRPLGRPARTVGDTRQSTHAGISRRGDR